MLVILGTWLILRYARMPETYTELPLLTDRFDRALRLASHHHRAQLRKGTEIPYVSHLLGGGALGPERGGGGEGATPGWRQDAGEGGGGEPMLTRIRAEYGEDVARIVRANSDTITEPK